MKKKIIKTVVSVSLILCLLSGCGEPAEKTVSTENPSKETSSATSAETASTETETFGRLFALSLGEGAVDAEMQTLSRELAKPATLGLEVASEYKVFSDTAKTIPSPFGDGDTYTYEKSDCDFKDEKKEEYGSFYSVYDSYRNEDGDQVKMLHNTNIIGSYFSPLGVNAIISDDNSWDEAELKKIAEDFLRNILPETYVDSLTYDKCELDRDSDTYWIAFHTEIEGYDTDDDQIVFVNNGVVTGYHGFDAMKYETLKDDITVEKLDAAKAALEEKLASDEDVVRWGTPMIVTNTSGELYLSMVGSRVFWGSTVLFTAYTNIL